MFGEEEENTGNERGNKEEAFDDSDGGWFERYFEGVKKTKRDASDNEDNTTKKWFFVTKIDK